VQFDRTNAAFSAAFHLGNSAELGAVYTTSAQLFPPNTEVRRGNAEIQAFWQGTLGIGVTPAELETVEFEEVGNSTWEVGTFSSEARTVAFSTWVSIFSSGTAISGI